MVMFVATRVVSLVLLVAAVGCSKTSPLTPGETPGLDVELASVVGSAPIFVKSFHYLGRCTGPTFATVHPDLADRDWTTLDGYVIDEIDPEVTDPRFVDATDRVVFPWGQIYADLKIDENGTYSGLQTPPDGRILRATTWAGADGFSCGDRKVDSAAIAVRGMLRPREITAIEPEATTADFFALWEKQAADLRVMDDLENSYVCPGGCGIQTEHVSTDR
jgi:hypothetical protein